MSCCSHACSIACQFDHLIAKRDLERYRRSGPDKSTKRLIDAIASAGVSGATLLDRVICCYPDMARLVGSSVQRARRLYGAVYPRGSWWVRLMVAIENAVRRMKGNDFRGFVHAPHAIDAAIRDHGFTLRSMQRSAVWITALYERSPAGS